MRTLILISALLAAPTLAAEHGVFKNPSGSVSVKLADCGKLLCGTIVSASAKARADAAKAGQPKIVGMQLFREMKPTTQPKGGPRRWDGKVFIPDLNKTVGGHAILNGRTLTVEGCLLGERLCKGQDWTRVK